MKRLLLLACLVALPCAAKETVKLCFDNEDAYPSTLKNGTGLSFYLLNIVAKQLDVQMIYTPLPWKRCLKEVETGSYDGVIGIAYLPERRSIAAFPLNSASQVLHEQRLLTTTRSVYRRKGSSNSWDGKQFVALNGPVGVQAGYMAASVLKQRQIPSEDSSQSTDDIFRKLSVGLIQIAVVEERQGDRSLKTHPEYANKIEKLAQPFLISDLFLAFSYPFQNTKTKLSQAIWQEITHVRESSQYKNTTQE